MTELNIFTSSCVLFSTGGEAVCPGSLVWLSSNDYRCSCAAFVHHGCPVGTDCWSELQQPPREVINSCNNEAERGKGRLGLSHGSEMLQPSKPSPPLTSCSAEVRSSLDNLTSISLLHQFYLCLNLFSLTRVSSSLQFPVNVFAHVSIRVELSGSVS